MELSGIDPKKEFTLDERHVLTHVVNITDFAAAISDPILRRYLDWYIAHLQNRLAGRTSLSVTEALRPHLSNTAEVDQGLMHTLCLVSKALMDAKGEQSMRKIF